MDDEQRTMGISLVLSIALGAAIGAAIDNVGVGVAIGVAIGAAVGTTINTVRSRQAAGEKSDLQPGDPTDDGTVEWRQVLVR